MKRLKISIIMLTVLTIGIAAFAADQRIQWSEKMTGANDPYGLTDTLNRLTLVEHNSDGTHHNVRADSISAPTGTFNSLSMKMLNGVTKYSHQYASLTAAQADMGSSFILELDSLLSVPTGSYSINFFVHPLATGGLVSAGTASITFQTDPIDAGPFQWIYGFSDGQIKGFAKNVHVAWWGAKNDTTTDGTIAILSAKDSLSKTSGGIVSFSSGTYKVSAQIVALGNVSLHLKGEGNRSTILAPTTALTGTTVIAFINTRDSSIEDMQILGNSAGPPSALIESRAALPLTTIPTHNLFKNLYLGSDDANSMVNGIVFDCDAGNDYNNDMNRIENPVIVNYSGAAVSFEHFNSIGNEIIGGALGPGPVGVDTSSGEPGGTFTIRGTQINASVTQFKLGNRSDGVANVNRIIGTYAEGLGTFLTATVGTNHSIIVEGVESLSGTAGNTNIDVEGDNSNVVISHSQIDTGDVNTWKFRGANSKTVISDSPHIGASTIDWTGTLDLMNSYFDAGTVVLTNNGTGTLYGLGNNRTNLNSIAYLAIRDTLAPYDVSIVSTSSTTLTATRTLTLDLANTSSTLKILANSVLNQDVSTTSSPTFVATNVTYVFATGYIKSPSFKSSGSSAVVTNTIQGGDSAGGTNNGTPKISLAAGVDTNSSATGVGVITEPTYSQTGTAGSVDFKIHRIETAIGSGIHKFISLVTGSTEEFYVDRTGAVWAQSYSLGALNTAPTSSVATGTAGQIKIDANYVYVCTATNHWKRAALGDAGF